MKSSKQIAEIILGRRNTLSVGVQDHHLKAELGHEGLNEALRRHWLEADEETGHLAMSRQASRIKEMRECAASVEVAVQPAVAATFGYGREFTALHQGRLEEQACERQPSALVEYMADGVWVPWKDVKVGEEVMLATSTGVVKKTGPSTWASIDGFDRSNKQINFSDDKTVFAHHKHHASAGSAGQPSRTKHAYARNDGQADDEHYAYAKHPNSAQSAEKPDPRQASLDRQAQPVKESEEDAEVGDEVVVAADGKSYQATVQSRKPDGKLVLSFGAAKPSTTKEYGKGEFKVTKKSGAKPGQPSQPAKPAGTVVSAGGPSAPGLGSR